MNQPSPAIVGQDAVRRLPRWALLLLCASYVLPGFIGRAPWKNADIASFGIMAELVAGTSSWLNPSLMGVPPEAPAPLAYWIGAWAMQLAPAWLAPEFAVRLPFMLMLVVTLSATWYGVYYLARDPLAQPVSFAFGGEASVGDYARALADGGLLALLATLGLAQFSHETTPALVQLCFVSCLFVGLAVLPWRPVVSNLTLATGLIGLALSGAPSMALGYGLIVVVGLWSAPAGQLAPSRRAWALGVVLLASACAGGLGWWLDLLRWHADWPRLVWSDWRGLGRLLLWFTWPMWPLVLWSLWRWRRQLRAPTRHRYLRLPLMMLLVPLLASIAMRGSDRALLLAVPALAALAAFALPTLQRSVSALIDWFTVLFFTAWGIAIWVVWLSMQLGVPAKPAANVARLAPGFEPVFQPLALVTAATATLAWIALVRWRTRRLRKALWKSLVLPAAGATLCWLLMMTLWLPVLDYARSFAPQMRSVRHLLGEPDCVQVFGLSMPHTAGLRLHTGWRLKHVDSSASCPWLVVDRDSIDALPYVTDMTRWELKHAVRRPTDDNDTLLLLQHTTP